MHASNGDSDLPLQQNREFIVLWVGSAVSGVGSAMSTLVFPLYGYALTGSTFLAGLAATGVLLGQFIGGLVSGPLVDRWSKRTTIVWANVAASVALSSVAVSAVLSNVLIEQLIAVGLVVGISESFLSPAVSSAVRQVVPAKQISFAYTRLEIREHFVNLVGPPIGGLLYSLGRIIPFVVDSVTYVIYAVIARRMLPELGSGNSSNGSYLHDAREGFQYIWRSEAVRAATVWGALFNFAMAYVVTVVTLNLVQAGVSPLAIGLVDTFVALGGLLGAFVASRILPRLRTGYLAIATGVAFSIITGPLGTTTNVVIVILILAVGIVLLPANNAGISAYVAAATPIDMQARVNAAGRVLSVGLAPAAPPLGGLALHTIGAPLAALLGSVFLLLSIAPLVLAPAFRNIGRPDEWSSAG